ncbi:hypothetical protein AB0C38_13530 [Amycolatopsis sp. NPDC048633]|uniref:hypothetical protein n=1 Tax=Amycolatopsis sp. NPDC048633 TaxID=3157095 RepID=UPI0033F127CA
MSAKICAGVAVVSVAASVLLGAASIASAEGFGGDRQQVGLVSESAAASWHFFGFYGNATNCINTGSEGVSQGRWSNYRCIDGAFIWRLDVYY